MYTFQRIQCMCVIRYLAHKDNLTNMPVYVSTNKIFISSIYVDKNQRKGLLNLANFPIHTNCDLLKCLKSKQLLKI